MLEELGLGGAIGWLQWHGGPWVCGASCSHSGCLYKASSYAAAIQRVQGFVRVLVRCYSQSFRLPSSLSPLVSTLPVSPTSSLPPGLFVRSGYGVTHLLVLSVFLLVAITVTGIAAALPALPWRRVGPTHASSALTQSRMLLNKHISQAEVGKSL